MQILIDNKPAVIKKDSSFEVNLKSSLFYDNEVFSLNIDFPLDIKENRDIFGSVVGFDGFADNVYNCVILGDNLNLSGYLKVLSQQNNIISAQFIQDFVTRMAAGVNSIYIDELELGCVCDIMGVSDFTQLNVDFDNQKFGTQLMRTVGFQMLKVKCKDFIYGPFINEQGKKMSPIFQIYLWKLIDLLSDKIGYRFNLPSIDGFEYILIGNIFVPRLTTAVTKDEDISKRLPHWTISEFILNLGKLFGCNVIVDHYSKIITFSKINGDSMPSISIQREIIEDDFMIETLDDAVEYRGQKGLKFKLEGEDGKIDSCDGVGKVGGYFRTVTANRLLTEIEAYATTDVHGVATFNTDHYMFIQGVGFGCYRHKEIPAYYFSEEGTKSRIYLEICIFNQQHIDGDDEFDELPFIPVSIHRNYEQDRLWQDDYIIAQAFSYEIETIVTDQANNQVQKSLEPTQDYLEMALKYSVDDSKYSDLYVCMYGPENESYKIPNINKFEPLSYCPIFGAGANTDPSIWHAYTKQIKTYTNYFDIKSLQNLKLPKLDMGRKYTIRVITNEMYNPNSIFMIEGNRYVCKNIKINATSNGISEEKELELYRIID